MRLSKIKLSGFKSFVDPTTLSFPSNLIGIVGPNGCGKSNLIDAIRWVLGESSAKTLRGDSMADVIFNGSSGRKPVGQASIELIFDNSDGTISGPYAGFSELSVRRVVSRDGTSLYFLNNSRCRRKDITHILLGTGLGSHGYSIIEQGMISRLVEAKPEELRSFLEEAAGISKYKERRRETEHRIRHTRDNLDRLGDLREELEKQLAHLQRQARAAERYKVLKAEERRVDAELLALRLKELRSELAVQEQLLKDRQLELEAAITEQGEVETSIEKLRVELTDHNESFNSVQGAYYRVGSEIARLEQSIQHRKSTVQRQNDDLASTDQQLRELSGHIDNDRVEIDSLERTLSELNPELEEASRRLDESERVLGEVESEVERYRERWDDVTQSIADTDRTVEVENARIEQLAARRERIARDRAEQTEAREQIDFSVLELGVEELIAAEEQLRSASSDSRRMLESVWEEIRSLRAEESSVSEELDNLRERLQRDRGRLSSLEALQEAALGTLSQEIDAWLERRSLGDRSRLAADLEVEPGWERAVETALGGYLNAVRVDDIDSVADGLSDLAGGGLALLEHGDGGRNTWSSTLDLPPLADKVMQPQSVSPLLAGILTAESLDAAITARRALGPGESIVTPEGVWVGRHSVRINPEDDPQLGVLARGEEIENLRETVARESASSDSVAARLGEIRQRIEELERTRAARQEEANQRQQAYAETRTRLEASRGRLEEARQRASALDRSIEALDDEQSSIARAIEEGGRKLDTAGSHRNELDAERERIGRDLEHCRERMLDARVQAEADREEVKKIEIMVESRRSSKESAAAALSRVQAQHAHLLKRRAELAAQIEQVGSPLGDEEAALVGKLDERLEVETELAKARSTVESCEGEVRDLETLRSGCQQAVNAARENAEAVRLSVREVQVRADTVNERLQSTEFPLDSLFSELPDEATIEAWTDKLEGIGRRIQRLGGINMAAIHEFEEQSERKQYLDKQFSDLTEALETLEAAIRKIDRETRMRFKETFDKANQGLGRLFPRLFGGGHAYLELDSEDLLSSGVTVMARPPGKRISTIHLMSGGEKALTAVALVFSIFELNPAPFCLLDEVDAPLDDANVGRFSELVREMAAQVQFVLITHNKTTMEAMHQLAGVTMHEPGVSRLVAVDIDEAVQLAAM